MGDQSAAQVVNERYLVLSRLGVGGSAAVYHARDLVLRRQVVLKVLHEWFAYDDRSVRRFWREASTAACLQHPNIVSAYDSGQWDGRPYIVLEHAPGRSLRSLVGEEAPLGLARAIDLTTQLSLAVRYIHRRGIIHRDLKPENVIIGTGGQLKLTDFGIARPPESDITKTGNAVGTAQYMSPEQAQGAQVGTASDLYSLGLILYELLTGRLPFEAESPMAVLLMHVKDQPPRASEFNAAVTRPLDAVVSRALEKEPTARYSSADAFMAALQRARAGVTTRSSAEPAVQPERPSVVERSRPDRESQRLGPHLPMPQAA